LLGVAGLVEAWVAFGVDPGRLVLVAALVAPLLWRRSRPLLALPLVAAAFVLQLPFEALRVLDQTSTCYIALIWAAYGMGRYAARTRGALVGTTACVASGLTIGLTDGSVLSALLSTGILTTPVWVGRAVLERVAARATLERQAQEITDTMSAAAEARVVEARALVAAEVQAPLADRVQTMVGLARRAAPLLPRDPAGAAGLLAEVEEGGRAALQDMRRTLGVLRDDHDAPLEPTGPPTAEPQAQPTAPHPEPSSSPGRRRAAAGLVLALLGVVTVNVAGGFTGVGDYVFPALLVTLAWVAVIAMRHQSRLLAAGQAQADELHTRREVRVAAAAVQERIRLARDLHDVVAHHLMVMVVQAGAARRTIESGRTGAAEALTVIDRTGTEVTAELRSLLELVDPGSRRSGPAHGMAELEKLVERVRAGGLDVDLSIVGRRRSLPGGLDLVAHRIVQESLTNVIRHAEATRVRVQVGYLDDRLTIEVTDDGRGVQAGLSPGLGVTGMRERAELYGGRCELSELPAGGVRVTATLPLEPAGAPA
jgi:signal transduction histidine kinase